MRLSAFFVCCFALAAACDDGGSTFECCQDNEITQCPCPQNAQCTPAEFTDCGGGFCIDEADATTCDSVAP